MPANANLCLRRHRVTHHVGDKHGQRPGQRHEGQQKEPRAVPEPPLDGRDEKALESELAKCG
jgi:hypothetical protein